MTSQNHNQLLNFSLRYIQQHPAKAISVLDNAPVTSVVNFLSDLDQETLLVLAPYFSIFIFSSFLVNAPQEKIACLVNKLPTRLVARWIRFLEKKDRVKIFELLNQDRKKTVHSFLEVTNKISGDIADISIIPFSAGTTVESCLAIISSMQRYRSNYIYVTDERGRLVGVVSLRKLFFLKENKTALIETFVNKKVSSVFYHTPIHELVQDIRWDQYDVLPVVNSHQEYLGVITYRQIRVMDPSRKLLENELISSDLAELYHVGVFSIVDGICSFIESNKQPDKKND